MKRKLKRARRHQPRPKLEIELVPESAHFQNVRNAVGQRLWDKLRRECYKQAGYRCEICGGRGPRHPVEAHEVWDWREEEGVQRLVRLIALCPACHEVKHFGLAELRGRDHIAFKHLCEVNGWTRKQGDAHVEEAFATWNRRSQKSWTLDGGPLAQENPEIKKRVEEANRKGS